MWLLAPLFALLSCVPRLPDTDLVTGLEVVTVVAEPPQVVALEPFDVTAFVADARQRGADVLVWPCTPVELGDRLRCAEGIDVNGRGIPLSYWTEMGQVRDHRYTAKLITPLLPFLTFADTANDDQYSNGLLMPVYAVACDPGVCELFDWVRADPAPGSEAYARAARALADTEQLAKQAPIGQMSVAVKFLTVVDPLAERHVNPSLQLLGRKGVPDAAAFSWQWRVEEGGEEPEPEPNPTTDPYGYYYEYYYGDDDDDDDDDDEGRGPPTEWGVRLAYTSGRVLDRSFDGTDLLVDWHGDFDRPGVMIVSISDGEGGTAASVVELPQRE